MTHLNLTIQDIAHEYAPYHMMAAFTWGLRRLPKRRTGPLSGVDQQAYDRGAECAARVERHNQWIEENVGLN